MKNDFREFYDEDYVAQSIMAEESDDYIAHGRILNAIHKYIDKFKNKKGKWVYVYPGDNVNAAAGRAVNEAKALNEYIGRQQREYDYNMENRKSGQGLAKARNRNAMAGDSRYKSKNNAMEGDARYKGKSMHNNMWGDARYKGKDIKVNNMGKDARYAGKSNKQSDYSRVMNAQLRKNSAARGASNAGYVAGRNKIGGSQSDYSIVMNNQERARKAALKKQRKRENEKKYAKYIAQQKKKNQARNFRRSLAAPFR